VWKRRYGGLNNLKSIQNRFAIFVLAAAVLAGMACSFSLPGAGPSPTAPQVGEARPSQAPQATEGGQAMQVPAELETRVTGGLKTLVPTLASGGQKAPQLSSVGTNLDTLDSYHMSFVIDVNGSDKNKKPATQHVSILQEVIQSKNQSHLKMSGISLAGAGDNGSLDIYQIDQQSYLFSNSGDARAAPSCLSFSASQPTIDTNSLLKPEDMLKDIQIQELIAKGEMVNGVKTDHYKVSQANLGFGTSKDASGDIWIAEDGGYAVKFTGTATGSFDIGDNSIDGTLTWEYNLTGINSLQAIGLPPECESQQDAMGDLPVPPGVSDIANLGKLISFSSPDKPAVVADFYRAALPDKGWKITNDSGLGADLVTLDIRKGDQTMTILITGEPNSGGSSILITSK
jgi:hypothetical protein